MNHQKKRFGFAWPASLAEEITGPVQQPQYHEESKLAPLGARVRNTTHPPVTHCRTNVARTRAPPRVQGDVPVAESVDALRSFVVGFAVVELSDETRSL